LIPHHGEVRFVPHTVLLDREFKIVYSGSGDPTSALLVAIHADLATNLGTYQDLYHAYNETGYYPPEENRPAWEAQRVRLLELVRLEDSIPTADELHRYITKLRAHTEAEPGDERLLAQAGPADRLLMGLEEGPKRELSAVIEVLEMRESGQRFCECHQKDLQAVLLSSYTLEIGPSRDKVHDGSHGIGDFDLKSTEVGQALFKAQQQAAAKRL